MSDENVDCLLNEMMESSGCNVMRYLRQMFISRFMEFSFSAGSGMDRTSRGVLKETQNSSAAITPISKTNGPSEKPVAGTLGHGYLICPYSGPASSLFGGVGGTVK